MKTRAMLDKIDRIVYNIIHMPNHNENVKKTLLVKFAHSASLKNGKPLEQEDVVAVFDTCISIITTEENEGTAQLAAFSFNNWAGQYKEYLKEYLTPEKVTNILGGQINNVILIVWLKETLCLLMEDADVLCTLAPILDGILQSKLRDFGDNSAFLAKLADLYSVCPAVLPQPHTRLTFTVTLMKCVASFPTPTKTEVLGHMKSVGGLINTLWNGLMLDDILYSLRAMYAIISNTDGGPEVCPAMAHLLSLVPTVVVEALAPRIVSDPSTTDAALSSTLTRLTAWLVLWPIAHQTLGFWVRTLVRLLYQNGRASVPTRVTLERVPKLLNTMQVPVVRNGIVSVISTLLLSLQHSPIAFHKSVSQLLDVFGRLEREGSDNARITLNQLSNLVHTLMALHPGYPQTYQPLMDVLRKYPSPSDKEIQNLIKDHAWSAGERGRSYLSQIGSGMILESTFTYHKRAPSQRVGLRNLGNTCYMNSVIQALFMTDTFRHQILHAVPRNNQQLLVKLQQLFSLLCFTNRTYVAPRVFHDKSRPPWFNPGMQQDCSEYLRHLIITLHEEEGAGQKLPEYQERIIIESETASLASDLQPLPYDSSSEDFVDMEQPPKVESCFEGPTCTKTETVGLRYGNHVHARDVEMTSEDMKHSTTKSKVNCDNYEGDHMEDEPMDVCGERDAKDRLFKYPEESFDVHGEGIVLRHADIASKSSHFKRKHSLNREGVTESVTKSTMMSSDIDNSSDSGISGDLAEDVELRSPNTCSPSPKESSFLPTRDLIVEEVVIEDSSIAETDNDYFVSLVHKIFGGKLATHIKCLQCKTESIHRDTFTDIHLAFQDTDRYNATTAIRRNPECLGKQNQQGNATDLRIEDMITSYLTSEMLTGENQYECERCGGKQDAERSIQILEPPEHLMLTQLRFYYDITKGQRQKVFTNVEFGEELLLPVRFSTQGIVNDHYSLSHNKGASLQGFLSGNETVTSDVCTTKNNASVCANSESVDNSTFSVQCQDSNSSNIFSESRYQVVDNMHTKTSYHENSTNEILGQSLHPSCSKSFEKTIHSSATVLTEPHSQSKSYKNTNSGDSSNSGCDGFEMSCSDSVYKSAPYLEPRPSCSTSFNSEYAPKHAPSDIVPNSSEESSGCMTPQGRSDGDQEEEATYARYALYGVVVHSGFSSEGGHYYCYARNSSIACLPESARERYGALGGWYNFNDERVSDTSFSAINNLTKTFSRDTAYQLFYKKLSDCLTPDVPLMEDLKSLRLDLREAVECDNLQYQSEQDREAQRRRCHASGISHFPNDSDHDGTPPPGGCGGGPGFNTPSRVVF